MDGSTLTRRMARTAWPSRSVGAAGRRLAAGTAVGVAVAMGASAPTSAPLANGLLRGLMVAAPLIAAGYAVRRPAYRRFGHLLAIIGIATFVSTLAESSDAVLYSIGRSAGWVVEALLVILVLSFPTGRLVAPIDRRLAGATAAVIALLFAPALVISPTFPVPSPYTSCTDACPPNALYPFAAPLTSLYPADVGGLLVFALMVGAVLRLQQRSTVAAGLGRHLLAPLVVIATVRTALVGAGTLERVVYGDTLVAEVCLWLVALATPLLAMAFVAGLFRMRLFGEAALCEVADSLRRPHDARTLERDLARAFDDPALGILLPSRAGGWIDVDGHPVAPHEDDRRRLCLARDGDGAPVAGLLCDRTFAEDPALLAAGTSMTSLALQNLRLRGETATAAHELHRSRARIAATADRERRRIERDLHDGAQQRLVAVRIELGLLEDVVHQDDVGSLDRIRALEGSVEAALEDLRSLAHGVHPPLLADRGLAEALRAVAARSPVRADVHCSGVGRCAPEVESAIYFCVLEALQNVAKHASGARHVEIRLYGGARALRFSVRDDGPGAAGDPPREGTGMTNMRDRVAAVGGGLTIVSRAGLGTTVRGEVPLARLSTLL